MIQKFHREKFHSRFLFRQYIRILHEVRHFRFFLKWIGLAVLTGIVCGLVGTAFHYVLDFAAEFSGANSGMLFLLPLAGLIIVYSYRKLNVINDEGTNSILRSARAENTTALRITPLIFTATFLTHVCGGSAGREGAALQIGGSLGSFISRKIKLDKYDHQLMVMCGMSATFCALFGTPVTAAFFSIEVAGVGTMFYAGLVPALLASVISALVSVALGVTPMAFRILAPSQEVEPFMLGKVMILAVMIAILSIIFCSVMHGTATLYKKYIPNPYIRVIAGGLIVIAITLISGTRDYNGAGMSVIENALSGTARPEAFALKIILTALTLGAGYKGGEIVPSMFIGATFGCAAAPLLGISPSFAAELGLIGFLCGSVNCPISCIFLSIELFGASNFLLFAITCAVTYLMSGYYSLYSGQKFMNSKIIPVPFEHKAE